MMNYADSEFYIKHYTKIPTDKLTPYLRRANAYVDSLILRQPTEITDDIRYCVCEIADIYYSNEIFGNGYISSENNDGYSVTYKNTGVNSLKKEIHAVVSTYLLNTGLLYRGIG